MNLQELSAYLQRECYQPNAYHIGSGWGASGDTYCITRVGDHFEIFYVERGQREEAIHRCEDEAAACAAFLAVLDRDRFSRAHCVGFFIEKSEADSLSERLASGGINVHRDTIPYSSATDMRYRVFVFGRDKTRAQQMIGHDAPPMT